MIELGERLYLSGGADPTLSWLNGNSGYEVTVAGYMPGRGKETALLVKFDDIITTEHGITGLYAVIELRFENTTWEDGAIVQVELCNFLPDKKPRTDRQCGHWVEANAVVKRIAT